MRVPSGRSRGERSGDETVIGGSEQQELRNIPLLADVSVGQRRAPARLVDEITVDAGEVIMAEGEQGYEFVFLIEEGKAE